MSLQPINWNALNSSMSQSAQANVQQNNQMQNDLIEEGMNISDAMHKAGNPFQPTATELREKNLREATERAKARLGSGEEAVEENNLQIADRLKGLSEEEVQAKAQSRSEVRAMSDDERVDNWFRLKQNDPTAKEDPALQTAIDSGDWSTVRLNFSDKPKTLELIEDARKAKIATLQTRNFEADDDENHSELINWDNLGANIASGISETTGVIEGGWNVLTKDGKERLEAMQDPNNLTNQLQSLDWGNASHNLAKVKSDALNQTSEEAYAKTKAQAQKENYSEDEVKALANKASQSAYWEHVFQNKQGITSEMVEMIPDALTAIGSAGVVSLVKKGGIEAVEKAIAKKVTEANLKREASKQLSQEAIEATTAKLTERATKNAIKAAKPITTSVITAKEAIETGLSNAPEGYNNASQAVMDMDINVLKNTKGFQELKSKNPNSSDEDIKKLLADKAGSKAYKDVAVATGLTGVLSGFVEGKLVSKLGLGGKGSIKQYGTSVGLSAAGEGAEEYQGTKKSNEAVKETTGLNIDTEKGAVEAAITGAISGAGTTTLVNSPEIAGTSAKTVGKQLNKLAQKSTAKMQAKQVESEAKENQSLFGTSSYTDKDGNEVKGQKGVLGKDFDESNIGKSYKEAIDELGKASSVIQDVIDAHGKHNYTQTIHALYQGYANARKALENPDGLSKEEVEGYTALKDAYEAFQVKVGSGAVQDLADYNNELFTAIGDMHAINSDPNATNEDRQAAINKVNELSAKDEGFQKLVKSSLYAMLSPDLNEASETIKDMPKEVSFLDGKDKENYPEVYNSVSDHFKQIGKDLKDSKITEEDAYKRYGDALTAIQTLKDTKASTHEKLTGIKNLLNQMQENLHAIGKDFGDNSPFKVLHQEISKWSPSENTGDFSADDVFLQKFFGSQGVGTYSKNYKLGLLDYVTDYMNAKKNGTQFQSIGRLQRFYNTQVNKLSALNEMIHQMEKDDADGKLKESYSYKTAYKTLAGEVNKFTSLESAKRYRDMVMNDMESFHAITQSLLQGTARNHTKPKTKLPTTPVNTEELNDLQNSTNQPDVKKDEPKEIEVKSLRQKDGKSVATIGLVMDDSLPSLAATTTKNGKRTVKLRNNISKEDFDNYIQGKDESPTSIQKQIVFNQLEVEHGINQKALDNLIQQYADRFLEGNVERALKRFIIEHELSHVENLENDSKVYKEAKQKSPEDYLKDPAVLSAELRANVDAIEALGSRLGLGSNITEIADNLNEEQKEKDSEPEVLLGLPYYSDVNSSEAKTPTMLDVQERNYEALKSHLAHAFAEMNNKTLAHRYGTLSSEKVYTVTVPLNNAYNVTTDNDFVKVEGDTLTVNFPEEIAKDLIKFGFDVEQNSFDKYVRVDDKQTPTLSEETIKAMASADIKNFMSDEAREARNVIGEQLTDGTFDPTHGENALFIESLIPVVKQIYTFFKGNQKGVFNRHNRRGFKSRNTDLDSLPRFAGFNFLTNLFGIEYSDAGRVRISLSERVIQAYTLAIPKGILTAENRHFHGNLESLMSEKGKTLAGVYNITKELSTNYSSQIKRTDDMRIDDYSALSGTKRDFIKDLGETVFEGLGLKTTKATSMNQEEAMKFSLGLEAYNFMLNNGLVQEYLVDTTDNSIGEVETQTYFGFTWNNPSLMNTEEYEATRLLRGKVDKMDNDAYTKATQDLNKKFNSSVYGSVLGLLRTAHSEAADAIFGEPEMLHGVAISNLQDEIGKSPSKGIKAEDSHGKTRLTTGNNEVLKDALGTANSVAFSPDENAFSLYDNQPEFYKVLNGAIPSTVDIDSLPITQESKDALRSRQLRIDRDFRLIDTYRGMALAQGVTDFKDTVFRFLHTLATNSRIMFTSDLNPVESKPVREMLNPIEFTLGEDENGYVTVQGTITPTFKVTKNDKPRDFNDLVELANSKRKQANDAKGFILALAQAMGVKVEKKTFEHIVELTKDKLPEHEEMIKALWEAQQQGKNYKPDLDMAYKFYNKYGTGSSRLMKALMAYGQYQYQNVKGHDNQYGKAKRGELNFHLYLEADGIANGFYNILKQFSTYVTPAYIKAQKRTGNITFDILAQNLDKLDKLEGARSLFDTYNLNDMYQHIASSMEDDIKKNIGILSEVLSTKVGDDTLAKDITPFMRNTNAAAHLSNIIGKGKDKADNYYAKIKADDALIAELESIRKKINNAIGAKYKGDAFFDVAESIKTGFNYVNTYGQIIMLGGVDSKHLDKINRLLLKGDTSVLRDARNIPAFSRGLAKLGVTPAMYGGKVAGITNQILTNLKPELLKTLDSVYSLVEETIKNPTENNWKELQSKFSEARAFSVLLGIPSPLFTNNKIQGRTAFTDVIVSRNPETLKNYSKSLQKELNGFVDYFNKNKRQVNQIITDGLGTFLNNAIQREFSEHFGSIEFTMNLNQSLFNVFMNEFTSKLPEFIKQRNKEKGYTELQGSVGITRGEVIHLMKQMKNLPIVGTAFSSNAELIDSLVDLGNTLLKTDGTTEIGNSTNVSSNFGNGSGHTAKSDQVRVYHEGTQFAAAGASINTASVPSTEAMTLNLVQKAMNRVGKAFLNVFDGLDAKFQIRDEVGIGANRETFEVHSNTNLLEAMFQMFNRTSFEEITATDKDGNFKDEPLMWNMYSSMLIAMLSADNTYYETIGKAVGLEEPKEQNDLLQEVKNTHKYTQKYLEYRNKAKLNNEDIMSYSEYYDTVKDDDERATAMQYRMLNLASIQSYIEGAYSDAAKNDTPTVKDTLDAILNKTLHQYKKMVVNNYAIRQLEKNNLPIIVNQFGGSNTGYAHNLHLLKNGNSLVSRFAKFIEGEDVSTQDAMSEALAQFINQDTELQAKLTQYKEEKSKQLPLNFNMDTSGFDVSKIGTAGALLNFLQTKVPLNTIQGVVAHAVGQLGSYLSTLNSGDKIYTDLNEFIEAAKKVYNVDEKTESGKNFLNSLQQNTNGKFVEGVGIYLHPETSFTTAVHELVHSMTRNKFKNYYSNQRYRLSFGEKQAIKNIELNARKFTKRMLLESDVMDAVETLRKTAIENLLNKGNLGDIRGTVDDTYTKYSPARASAINFQYAFEVLPTIDGVQEADVLRFQEAVMHEFISYGLTEADMLRELKFASGEEFGTFNEKQSGISKRIAESLKSHYNALSDEMANVLGINKKSDAGKSALFNILTSLNVLAEASRYPNKFEISTLAGSKESVRTSRRNDTLNRTEFLIDTDTTAYPEVLNKMSLFGNSTEHKEHLNELTSDLTNVIQTDTTIPKELAARLHNPMDVEAQDLVSNLRTSGIRMTQDEENAFVLAYAANRVAMVGSKTLEQAGYKWLEDLSAILEPSVLSVSKDVFNKIINPMRSTPNKLSYMLALVATNEDIRNKLSNYYKAKPTSLKNKVKQSLAYTSVYSKQLATSDFAKGADILMDSVKAFETKDYRSLEQANNQIKALQEREEKLNQVARMLGDLTDSKHVETLVKAMQSGQGVHKDDMDSMFTEAMNEWINTYEKGKGRRTWIGTLVRLVVGSTSKTYQWYRAKNQNSTLLESVREKAASTIPAGIEAKFENLTKDDKRAIDAILLPTNFHKIKNFSGVQNKEVLDILTNTSKANFEKAKVSGYIRGELMTKFGDKQGERLYNIAMWQIKGLGSLMVTKKAKTSNVKESHYIMPNTRAISNLIGMSDARFQEAVDTLASIYALDYVDTAHKEQMAKLMSEQPEAFNEMLDSVETMYAKSMEKAPNSLVGEDGFVMNHRDPMSNVKVVEPNDTETLSDLRRRGYLEKAKLPTGHLVMHTNMDDSVRFTTGMFNLTESTVMGVNLSSMMSLNSKALRENNGKQTIPAKIMMAAGLNENYYDNLEQDTSRRIIIDHAGDIIDTAIDLPKDLENQLIPSTENGIDAIGNYFGRVIEEDTNISSNKHAVDLLRQHYAKNVSDRKYYIPFDGNYKAKSTDKKSVKMAEEINEIYKALPAKTKQYIESTGGVMIDMREIENILGYHQASLSDFWNDKSRLPEPVQKAVRGVFEVMAGTVGYNPVKLAVGLEKGTNELASFTKDIILNRSLFIPMSNLVSNILHLWTAGIPAKHIVPDTKEGLQLAKDYQATSGKVAQIEFLLLNHKLQPNERVKLTNELQVLKEKLVKSPIRPLVENGIFNSITNIDIGSDADVDFTLFKRVLDKTGIGKAESAVEDMIGKKLVDAALIRKGSPTHNFMVQSLDYGDFVAKYALYKHLTQRKGVPSESAMEVIRDEFVNYTMNRGREFDWTNKVGLTWFLSYKLAIQKVIFRNLRRNFLRTMTTYGLGKVIPDNALLDKTVIEQNLLFDSSLDYQLSPSNLINGWEQYIWHNLL